ncbi:MAG TPA: alternative ribosome rescue aminoacyl-tRNA hydrolase ArfB [Bacteroidales bacterium]|nr:alternative ribosome rescue aminoacyl-tRNA hydrolase ArfB [Bacteroidales bacterium]
MNYIKINIGDLSGELGFQATRSSGAGGQNVNKVNTRVELRFHVNASQKLSERQKKVIHEKLQNRINKQGELIVVSQSERTQSDNRKKAEERFYSLINKALKPVKKRKPTRPTKASKEKRLTEKKEKAEKKVRRKNLGPDL